MEEHMTDDDFKLDALIAADIDSLSDEFDIDAASHVAELRKQALDDARRDPRYQANAVRVRQARVALRRARIDLARKQQSNGIPELLPLLEKRFWDGRVLENLRAMVKPQERILVVGYFVIETSQRRITRAEAKRYGRTVAESNDGLYARQFVNDDVIRQAEAAERSREEQPFVPGRTGVSNSDWGRG
jgi:hypothetical protein